MRKIKFRAWNKEKECYFLFDTTIGFKGSTKIWGGIEQYTGLKDKNGKEGYFDSDIWEIKDYEYIVPGCKGYEVRKCNLRFILIQGLLKIEYKFIDPPEDLKAIALSVLFKVIMINGKRTYVDDNGKKLEIIGNIHER